MIYAGILAAGIGARMHRQDMPKPFLPLGEKPIIIHTLEQFFIHPRIKKIVIAVPESWKLFAEDLIGKYDTMETEVIVIAGGENKTISTQMIVDYIVSFWGVQNDDILLTHDAVRPFITQRIIDDNIESSLRHGASSTVMTTNDTIVVSQDGIILSEVPSKNIMFAEQTPQTFNLKTLQAVFESAAKNEISLSSETELPRLYIQQGHSMNLVEGEYFNMKIINPHDLEIALALLKEKKQ